jgi:transcriptional antiterminator RfaH
MYWCCAQVEPRRERLASHCLGLAGYEIYQPLLREQRRSHGRKITVTPPLFPGYLFVWVVRGWWDARWSPGVVRLIMDGLVPARVPDAVIGEIRSRERGGFVELPKPRGLRPGMRVRVISGPAEAALSSNHGPFSAGQIPRRGERLGKRGTSHTKA